MLSFSIDPKTTKHLWVLQERMTEAYAQLIQLPAEERNAIHRYARVSQIGASTRIENAVLTDAEISWIDTLLEEDGKKTAFEAQRHVIEDKFSKDRERSIEEVAGCRAMLLLIYEQAGELLPLTESAVRGLHQELLRHYPPAKPHAGSYKDKPNTVIEQNLQTGEKQIIFQPADPGLATKSAMSDLVAWYNEALLEEAWTVAVASEFVFRFLAIHPFQDGNGRLGRGLFLMSLLQSPSNLWAYMARHLALDRQIEQHKEEYYFILNRCSEGRFSPDPRRYHLDLFLTFMMKALSGSLKDIEIYRKRYRRFKELSPSEDRVLRCFQEQPEVRLQTRDICRSTKLPRRTTVQALSKLVRKGFLQTQGQGAGVRYQLVF